MKRLSEMENALRKASGQVDRANGAVRRLETENAEIRAEMEASKLSASESVTACLEVAKREKKWLKKLLAWEKQKAKL
ncbi:MND1-interacting protein 1-like, partial [Trifolium medium]|nr:MND1-interacting protein 1-like [Trifolium medium]